MTPTFCRICKSRELISVLNLGNQVYTGIFPKSKTDFVPKGELDLVYCASCSLVQLSKTFDKEIMYGENYGYQSALNDSMKEHLNRISRFLINRVNLSSDDIVVDIGSNDGTFLSFFSGIDSLIRIGIDPTLSKFENKYEKEIVKVADFFTENVFKTISSNKAKLITSISMMYDLDDPIQFARDVHKCLRDDGYWFFEQSYLGLMLDKLAFDTICHEHVEYYSANTLSRILKSAGFIVESFSLNLINGGSIAILARKIEFNNQDHSQEFNELLNSEIRIGLNSLENLTVFAKNVLAHKAKLFNLINKFVLEGKKVMALGASTKGNVLLQFCGLTNLMIHSIGEVNQDKLGHFTPGTNIPIVSEDEIFKANPDLLVILPWHFRSTFMKKTEMFRKNGGIVLFPLPEIDLVKINL